MEKSNKEIILSQQKSIHQNESGSKTFIDSLYNSNSNEKNKENMNINIYHNNITKNNVPKINNNNNNIQKQKNFYLALRTLNLENSQNNNISKTSQNLISKLSEFSEMNPDISKDYNNKKANRL